MEYLQAMVQIQDTEEMHFTATETTRNSANSMGRANRASEAVVQAQNLVATARARMDAEDRRTANLRTTLRRQEEALREERRRQVRELEAAIVNHAVATRSAAADATTSSSRTVNSKDTTTDRNPEGSSVNVRPLQSNPSTSAYAYRSSKSLLFGVVPWSTMFHNRTSTTSFPRIYQASAYDQPSPYVLISLLQKCRGVWAKQISSPSGQFGPIYLCCFRPSKSQRADDIYSGYAR